MKFHDTARTAALTAALLAGAATVAPSPAAAHETDQFLMPTQGEFADLGRYFSDFFGEALRDGVAAANRRIDEAEGPRARPYDVGSEGTYGDYRPDTGGRLGYLRSSRGVADMVRKQIPDALTLIDGLEWNPPDATQYGYGDDAIVIYKPHADNAMHTDLHFILDPRIIGRIWRAGTFQAYGSYMGADKIGHFVDMGHRYYKHYDKARDQGKGAQEAMEQAVKFGMNDGLIGENALLGRLTAGAYSNADLCSNYVGMLFYRNLTEPVLLRGQRRPPMLELDEHGRWTIADHVASDPDFFQWFLSDHYNEALNPSHFENGMQSKVREAIAKRWYRVAGWYADDAGRMPNAAWFTQRTESLATYHGQNYGHCQVWDELYHLGNVTPDRGDEPEDALALDRK